MTTEVEVRRSGSGRSTDPGSCFPRGKIGHFVFGRRNFGPVTEPQRGRLALRGRGSEEGGAPPIDFGNRRTEGDMVVPLGARLASIRVPKNGNKKGSEQGSVVLEFANDSRLYVSFGF